MIEKKFSWVKFLKIATCLSILPLFLVIAYLKYLNPIDGLSVITGVIGFGITFYQLYQAAKSKEYEELSKYIDKVEQDYLRAVSEASIVHKEKNEEQQQMIGWILERLSEVEIRIASHEKAPAHSYTLSEQMKIQEQIVEIRAAIAVLLKVNDFEKRLSIIESFVHEHE